MDQSHFSCCRKWGLPGRDSLVWKRKTLILKPLLSRTFPDSRQRRWRIMCVWPVFRHHALLTSSLTQLVHFPLIKIAKGEDSGCLAIMNAVYPLSARRHSVSPQNRYMLQCTSAIWTRMWHWLATSWSCKDFLPFFCWNFADLSKNKTWINELRRLVQ